MNDLETANLNHPFSDRPYLWDGRLQPPPLADPEDPMKVIRSHLNKLDPGKSSSSCKVAFTTRLHRKAAFEQRWCASFEEAQVYENIAANPNVVAFKEQFTRTAYIDPEGRTRHTLWDCHALMIDGSTVLVSVKYDEKARRRSYLDEVSNIALQCPAGVADRVQVLSRFSFHPTHRQCAKLIHTVRRGWDPERDRIVLEAANDLGAQFTFQSLIDASRLNKRGYRAAIRVIADGDIGKDILDPFSPDTQLWKVAA